MSELRVRVFECGCQAAADAAEPRALHVAKRCPVLPAGYLQGRSWAKRAEEFKRAHKGYWTTTGRWIQR